MNWLWTTLICVVLIELAVRLPFAPVLTRIGSVGRKSVWTLRARASDHWKEKAMQAYAVSLFSATAKLAACLIAVGGLAAALILAIDHFGGSVGVFIVSWTGIAFSVVVAIVYFKLRKAIV